MEKIIVESKEAPAPIGPYSQAVKAGNTLYVSGQIPLDAKTGEIVSNGIESETIKVMDNIKAILDEAKLDFSNVVKCTIFMKNLGDFTSMNAIYGKYFTDNAPARECVEVSKLPKGVNIEISCIASY